MVYADDIQYKHHTSRELDIMGKKIYEKHCI